MRAAIDAWWFAKAPPERLALLRIIIGVFCLAYHGSRYDDFVDLTENDPRFFAPVGALAFWSTPPAAYAVIGAYFVSLLANVAFIGGYRFRLTGPVFALSVLLLTSYRNSWSMVYHSENVLVWHVLVLGISPAAAALSLDARGTARGPSWRYGWPVRLICAVTVVCYLLAGIAKITGELGWGWADGDTLRKQIATDALRKMLLGDSMGDPLIPWEMTWVFTAVGLGTLVLELGAPAALIWRRIGMAWALQIWSLHWGIFAIMGIQFRYQLTGIVILSFLEPERAWFALQRWRERRQPSKKRRAAKRKATSEVKPALAAKTSTSTVKPAPTARPDSSSRLLRIGLLAGVALFGVALVVMRLQGGGSSPVAPSASARAPVGSANFVVPAKPAAAVNPSTPPSVEQAGEMLQLARSTLAGAGSDPPPRQGDASFAILLVIPPDGPGIMASGSDANLSRGVRRAASRLTGKLSPHELERSLLRLDVLTALGPPRALGEDASVELEPGLDGLYLPHVDAWLLGDELTALALYDEEASRLRVDGVAEHLSQTRGRKITLSPATLYHVVRFSSFLQDGQRTVALYRGNRMDRAPEPAALETAAIAGGDYLLAHQTPEGSFDYHYRPESDDLRAGYNVLRHAGTCYALYELYETTSDERFRVAAERGLKWLLEKHAEPPPADHQGKPYLALVDADEAKLGGAALATLALMKGHVAKSPGDPLGHAKRFAEFIVRQQRPNGHFISKISFEDGAIDPFESLYYPGEAMLALMRLYAHDPDPRWLEAAESASRYIREERDKGITTLELEHDHWQLMALNELERATKKPIYREHAERIAEAILSGMLEGPYPDWDGGFLPPPRSTPAATRAEAMIAMVEMAERAARPADRYRAALDRIVAFQLRCQVTQENALFFPKPARAMGGFSSSLTRRDVRIDYVQHSVSSMLGLRALKLKR